MEQNFQEKYRQQDYEPSADIFLEKTSAYLGEHHDVMLTDFMEQFQHFCTRLTSFLADTPYQVGVIQISLLHTSIYFGTPKIAFDAYDSYGVLGANLMHAEMEFPYLFVHLNEWKNNLKHAVQEKHYEIYVSDERIRTLMAEKTRMLMYFLVLHLKYPLTELDRLEWFQEMPKEPEFYVSVGEYEDWQKTVYGEVPFVDMFMNLSGESLRWQKYEQLVFRNKVFDGMDLSKIRFTDCHFINCTIKNCQFHDSSFLGCRFNHTTIENSSFFGSLWKECLIQRTNFYQCDWWAELASKAEEDMEERQAEDIYRPVMMESCSYHHVLMKGCNLNNVKVCDEHMDDFEIEDDLDGGEMA